MTEQNKDATTTEELSFAAWKAKVNGCVVAAVGLTCDDLPDIDYWSLYAIDATPAEAAVEAIQYAKES